MAQTMRTTTTRYPVKQGQVPQAKGTQAFGQFKRKAADSLPAFLTPDEKKALLADQQPFYLKAYRVNPANKFGDSITFTIIIDGEYRAMTMSHSIYRQALLEELQTQGHQVGSQWIFDQPVGPVVLAQLPNPDKTKNPIWDLVDPNDPEGVTTDDEPIA